VNKLLGYLALVGLLLIGSPGHRAEAASLLNPGVAAAIAQDETAKPATEVRWRHYRYRRHYHYRRHYGYRRHYWHRRYYRLF
jgi:ribosomal protein L21